MAIVILRICHSLKPQSSINEQIILLSCGAESGGEPHAWRQNQQSAGSTPIYSALSVYEDLSGMSLIVK
jgi:hypothetical protein